MSSIFNKVMLHTISSYLEKQVEDKETYERDFLVKILGALKAYQMLHRFDSNEAKMVAEIGEHEAMEKMKVIEIDFSIYSIELLQLFVDEIPKKQRPHLNIADKKIRALKANLIKDMLRLKFRDDESYARVKEIVDQSRLVAKRYFFYMFEQLKDNK